MRQFSTLYIPGCDHAGIATQAVVEKQLARHPKDGKSSSDQQDDTQTRYLCRLVAGSLHNESAVVQSGH